MCWLCYPYFPFWGTRFTTNLLLKQMKTNMAVCHVLCEIKTHLWHPGAGPFCGAGALAPPVSDGGSAGPDLQGGSSSLWEVGPNMLRRFINHLKFIIWNICGVYCWLWSLPGFRSMKSTTLGPSLTAPNSSTTRGELRRLHVLASSLLKWLSGIWDHTMTVLKPQPLEFLCFLKMSQSCLTLLAAHVNLVVLSWTQNTSPYEPFWMWWRTQYSSPSL